MLAFYLFISAIVIVFFVIHYPIFSSAYLLLVGLLLGSLIMLPFYHVVNVGLIGLCLLLPLLRLIYLVVFEIYYVLNVMTKRRSMASISKTCLLWLPFPLLALAGYYMLEVRDEKVRTSVEHFVYQEMSSPKAYACDEDKLICSCEGLSLNNQCPAVDANIYNIKDDVGEMERDLHIATQRLKEQFRYEIIEQIENNRKSIVEEINENGGDIEAVLFSGDSKLGSNKVKNKKWPLFKYSLSQYHLDLSPPSCNGLIDQLFKLRDCIKNITLEPLSGAYQDIRRNLRIQLEETIVNSTGSVNDKLDEVEEAVEGIIDHHLNNYSRRAHHNIEGAFATLVTIDRVSFLIWVVMVVYALLLGFLYLFIRYVYNQKHGRVPFNASASYAKSENRQLVSNSTIVVEDITVDDTMNSFSKSLGEEIWYASIDSGLRYEVDGIICVPRPLTLLFKRFSGRYFMFRYRREEGKQSINAHGDDLTRFIKVTLQEGQSVCFNFSNLVAFSNNLHLKATLSIPLAAFFQNQLFFSTAVGPGEFIIRTKSGKPEIMPTSGVKPSDPRDVVVFDLQGQFSLLADMNFLSAYFLGHRVVPCENTTLIRQSPDAKSNFSSQASAIRRTLYLLFPLTFVTIVLPWLLP